MPTITFPQSYNLSSASPAGPSKQGAHKPNILTEVFKQYTMYISEVGQLTWQAILWYILMLEHSNDQLPAHPLLLTEYSDEYSVNTVLF